MLMGCYHFFDAGQMEHMRRDVSRTGTVTSASSKQHASKQHASKPLKARPCPLTPHPNSFTVSPFRRPF